MAFSRLFGVLAVSGVLIGATPSYADFRYVPHAPVPVAPAASASDLSATAPMPMQTAPASIQSAPLESAPLNNTTVSTSMMGAPASAPVSRSTTTSRPASTASAMGSGGDIAQGFGRHVPLVMALREIAPAGYQLGYGPGVALGAMVDWQGGQSWRDVMKSVLSPLGLQASEQGAVVYIDAAR